MNTARSKPPIPTTKPATSEMKIKKVQEPKNKAVDYTQKEVQTHCTNCRGRNEAG